MSEAYEMVREDDYTWQAELFDFCSHILNRLSIPFTGSNLRKFTERENEISFRIRSKELDFDYFVEGADIDNPVLQLEAISHVLLEFDIKCETYVSELDKLEKKFLPMLTVLRAEKGREDEHAKVVLIEEISEKDITLWNEEAGSYKVSHQSIEPYWTGIILVIRTFDESGEKFTGEIKKENAVRVFRRASLVAVGVAAAVTACWMSFKSASSFGAAITLLLLIKLLAIGVCIQLKKLEVTGWYKSKALERFCKLKENFNCQLLLSTSAARLFGVISMSDIGLTYFGTTALALILSILVGNSSEMLGIIMIANILALPYTVFSVIYQRYVARYWCMLCLTVQLSLWLEFATDYYIWTSYRPTIPGMESVLIFSLLAGVVTLLAAYRGHQLRDEMSEQIERFRHTDLKRNATAFLALLNNGTKINDTLLPGDVVIGDRSVAVRLFIVLDPDCPICAGTYQELRKLQKRYSDRISLTVRLMSENTDVSACRDFVSLVLSDDKGKAPSLLDSWYKRVQKLRARGKVTSRGRLHVADYEAWKKEIDFPNNENSGIDEAMKLHVEFQLAHKFSAFPAFFVNSHHWPSYYEREYYLPYFLDDIEAECPGEPATAAHTVTSNH